uniref:Uncharacterized protein n=1 Tax=Anguilla anguilla TaxID=7936 RepID=A0A0E9XFP2_ANGAN
MHVLSSGRVQVIHAVRLAAADLAIAFSYIFCSWEQFCIFSNMDEYAFTPIKVN